MKILLLLITLAGSCYGRIGESFQECVERYGEPTKESAASTTFEKNGITIIIAFLGPGKKVGKLVYLASSDKLGTEEVKRLMQLNAPGKTWRPVKEATEDLQRFKYFKYKTLDGDLHAEEASVATLEQLATIVGVSTKAYREWVSTKAYREWKAKQKPEDPLKGF